MTTPTSLSARVHLASDDLTALRPKDKSEEKMSTKEKMVALASMIIPVIGLVIALLLLL